MHKLGRRTLVLALAAALVVAAGVAYAAIPDSTGAVNTCYRNSTGVLRVVDAAGDCGPSETALQLGGPTRGFARSMPGFLSLTSTSQSVATLQLPEGRYLVHAKANVVNLSTDEVLIVCALRVVGSTSLDQSWIRIEGWPGATFASANQVLQAAVSLSAPAEVALECSAQNNPSPDAIARFRQIDAVQVDALSATVGP